MPRKHEPDFFHKTMKRHLVERNKDWVERGIVRMVPIVMKGMEQYAQAMNEFTKKEALAMKTPNAIVQTKVASTQKKTKAEPVVGIRTRGKPDSEVSKSTLHRRHKETPEMRAKRLEKQRVRARKALENETPEKRAARLERQRIINQRRRLVQVHKEKKAKQKKGPRAAAHKKGKGG